MSDCHRMYSSIDLDDVVLQYEDTCTVKEEPYISTLMDESYFIGMMGDGRKVMRVFLWLLIPSYGILSLLMAFLPSPIIYR